MDPVKIQWQEVFFAATGVMEPGRERGDDVFSAAGVELCARNKYWCGVRRWKACAQQNMKQQIGDEGEVK